MKIKFKFYTIAVKGYSVAEIDLTVEHDKVLQRFIYDGYVVKNITDSIVELSHPCTVIFEYDTVMFFHQYNKMFCGAKTPTPELMKL